MQVTHILETTSIILLKALMWIYQKYFGWPSKVCKMCGSIALQVVQTENKAHLPTSFLLCHADICLKHRKHKARLWRERCWQEPADISDALWHPWTLVPRCGCCKHSCCLFNCCQHPCAAGGEPVGNRELCFSGSCVEKLPASCA